MYLRDIRIKFYFTLLLRILENGTPCLLTSYLLHTREMLSEWNHTALLNENVWFILSRQGSKSKNMSNLFGQGFSSLFQSMTDGFTNPRCYRHVEWCDTRKNKINKINLFRRIHVYVLISSISNFDRQVVFLIFRWYSHKQNSYFQSY